MNGTAEIIVGSDYLARFAIAAQLPRSVFRITVSSVFFQCSRAVVRAGLWNASSQIARDALPSAGTILRELSRATIDGDAYDQALPKRIADTLY